MSPALHGKTCTIALIRSAPSHERDIVFVEGSLEASDGSMRLVPSAGGEPLQLPAHLLVAIEPVTQDMIEGMEYPFETEYCLRAHYCGRRKFKTLGWNAVLEQSIPLGQV